MLGSILVTLGVFGELAVGIEITAINGQLRTKGAQLRSTSDQLLALVTQEAGDAKTSAQLADAAATEAKNKSDATIKELSKAEGQISDLGTKSENLDTKLSGTKTQLEAVESKRAELEKALKNMAVCNAPRVLLQWTLKGKTNVDSLRPFHEYKAYIEFVPNDAESRRAASHIAASLHAAQWEIAELAPTNEPVEDGVDVQPFAGPEDGSMAGAARDSRVVANAIVDFLHSYDWSARPGFLLNPKLELIRDPKVIPPDGLRIRVGMYPAVPFIAPPGMTDLTQAVAAFEKSREIQRKQNEERRHERDEKIFKALSPEEIKAYMARRQEEDEEEQKRESRYSDPCQPLVPIFPRP